MAVALEQPFPEAHRVRIAKMQLNARMVRAHGCYELDNLVRSDGAHDADLERHLLQGHKLLGDLLCLA